MVGVLFFYTQRDDVLVSTSTPSDNVVNVMGKRWGWDFNYVTNNAFESTRQVETDPGNGQEVTQADLPDLYLPVDRVTRFYLTSRDVAHSFWVPAFLMKMDTIPGRVNEFQVRPDRTGTFIGKCAEPVRPVPLPDAVRGPRRAAGRVRPAHRAGSRRAAARVSAQHAEPERPRAQPARPDPQRREHVVTATASTPLFREADWVAPSRPTLGRTVVRWATTTDHKVIGNLYFITASSGS
ncbi:hypothetical protein GCM10025868_43250 [Angustibacter aerolatus]|uniref:Cytochrome oxidase subunit II copper A binding domain-containing protein n=1 Tax=Angustibacter aerolatus TaxID=1162965 RepID=A0ABQ6JP78_9ACTN|nr:hypothetical protein [Angustibacter aerolatus]GMA89075.1 hypothetical protein GCM10025868_43250 [Angustibacter aerolatus]